MGLIPVAGNYISAASDYKTGHYIMAGVDLVFAALDETGAGEAEAAERITANALEREIPDSEDDVKFIGVYTSKVTADAAVSGTESCS